METKTVDIIINIIMAEIPFHFTLKILVHPTRAVIGVNVRKPPRTATIVTVLADIMA